jgi:hypothetical protein
MPVSEEKTDESRTDRPERGEAAEKQCEPLCDEHAAKPFRFDDPYWDDVFDSYHNPTLRTCCMFYG